MAAAPYIELHAHSAFSFLDGASTPTELAAAAAALGYPAFALTDHDGVWGSMEFAARLQGARGAGDHRRRADRASSRAARPPHPPGRERGRLPQPLPAADRGPLPHPRQPAAHRRRSRGSTLEQVEEHAEGLVCLSGCARDGALAGAWERGETGAASAGAGACSPPSAATASGSSCSAPTGAATAPATAGSPRSPRGSASPAWRPATSTPTTPAAPTCRTPSSRCGCGDDAGGRPSRSRRGNRARRSPRRRRWRARFAEHPGGGRRDRCGSPSGSAST